MDFFTIRNKQQASDLTKMLLERRLPYKIIVDDIYPARTLDMNAYYWGVVLKYISDESGHSILECHEAYKKKFNLVIEFKPSRKKGVFKPVLGVGSTATKNTREFMDYVFRVRADGELELNIVIPLPNESFVEQLDFKHDKVKEHRL